MKLFQPFFGSLDYIPKLLAVLPLGFWLGVFILAILPQLYHKWHQKIYERVDEMIGIMNNIKELASKGEYYRHLPVERTNFLKREAYIHLAISILLLVFCVIGFWHGYQLFASGWWSSINDKLSLPQVIDNSYARRPKGIAFIIFIKSLPFLIWYVCFNIARGIFADARYSCLWEKCIVYLKIDYKKLSGTNGSGKQKTN